MVRYAHLCTQIPYRLDKTVSKLAVILAGLAQSNQHCKFSQPLRCLLMAEFQHMRQHQRIRQTMGNTLLTPQLVSDGVNIAHVHLVDREACVVRAH